MPPRPITHQNILRVLLAGFSLVILLLIAAALVAVRNIDSIQQNAANLVREQSVTNRLISELHTQQSSLSEVFSVLARDPDSVDYDRIMDQLNEADRDIDHISEEGAQTPEKELWTRLRQTSTDFSQEARRILSVENLATFRSLDLFRDHEAFIAVVARLIEVEYRKVIQAQREIDERGKRLLDTSLVFAAASVLLAIIFAVVTVRMVAHLIRDMDFQTAELGRVSWHMLEDQEATARRFSHELHDELGQSLTAVKTNLAALELQRPAPDDRLRDCMKLVDEAIGNVRQMSQLLRPTILDDFGLEAGVRWLADGFSARTGIDVDFQSNYAGRLLDETETHLFRIAQEALTNIARHAAAKHVRVRLESNSGNICLSIQDDGKGLPPTPPPAMATARRPASLGMSGMRARARSAGGDLTVHSRPGEGVLIEVRLPLNHETHSNPVS
jgi:signal transduction histidine kinase